MCFKRGKKDCNLACELWMQLYRSWCYLWARLPINVDEHNEWSCRRYGVLCHNDRTEQIRKVQVIFSVSVYVLCIPLFFSLLPPLCAALPSISSPNVCHFLSQLLSQPSISPISLFQFPVSSSLLSSHSRAADCSKPRKSSSSHSANTICIGFALSLN